MTQPPLSSSSSSHIHTNMTPPCSPSSPSSSKLPLKPIPGSYGLPFFGAISDRHDFFYHQGRDDFFSSRIRRYNSTVFRTNMPPGPFIAADPRVVAVLDAISFPVLFDLDKVEKRNVLDGTFMPSPSFTGGHRVCAFLDSSEPSHAIIKRFVLHFLSSRHHTFLPLLRHSLSLLFFDLNQKHSAAGISFNELSDQMSFNFVFRLLCGADSDPAGVGLGSDGPNLIFKWLSVQLIPLATLGLPKIFNYLEDFLLRSVSIPSWTVKSAYKRLTDAFSTAATTMLDEAVEKFGIDRDEALHNLIFMAGFNAYGGMKSQLPLLFKWVGSADPSLHKALSNEIRTVVKSEGGITLQSLDKMTLTKSVVYEVLRIEPTVPYQYARARQDLVVRSHDAEYEIKKGEMIFGYQPLATKDPRVFENPEEFVGHRFVGEGEKLLKYVYWSNGRETEDPTPDNKQCPGKNLVVLMCRVMLVEFFLRYDTFSVEVGKSNSNLGASITFTSLTKAENYMNGSFNL